MREAQPETCFWMAIIYAMVTVIRVLCILREEAKEVGTMDRIARITAAARPGKVCRPRAERPQKLPAP